MEVTSGISVAQSDNRKHTIDNFQEAFQKTFDINMKEMQPTHTVHLGFALGELFYALL